MPVPKPNEETRDEWMDRCIPVLMDEGNENDQAYAICDSMWEDAQEEDSKKSEKEGKKRLLNALYRESTQESS